MLRSPETYRAGLTDPCSLTQVLMETPHLYSCTLVHREPWTSRPKDTHSHPFSQVLTQHTKTISSHAQAQKDTQTCLHLDTHGSMGNHTQIHMNTHQHKSHTCTQAYTDSHTLKHRHKHTHTYVLTYAHTHSTLINI